MICWSWLPGRSKRSSRTRSAKLGMMARRPLSFMQWVYHSSCVSRQLLVWRNTNRVSRKLVPLWETIDRFEGNMSVKRCFLSLPCAPFVRPLGAKPSSCLQIRPDTDSSASRVLHKSKFVIETKSRKQIVSISARGSWHTYAFKRARFVFRFCPGGH